MSSATLLAVAGPVLLFAGVALALREVPHVNGHDRQHSIAGALIVAGFGCLGASLGLVFGPPC